MKQQARCAARPRLRKVWSLTFTASSIAHSFRHRRLSPMQTDTCQLKTLLSNRHLQSLRGMGMHPPPCMDLLKETSREATQRIVLPLAGGSEQGWLLQRAQHKISTANECKNWGMASPRRSQIWIVPRGPPKKHHTGVRTATLGHALPCVGPQLLSASSALPLPLRISSCIPRGARGAAPARHSGSSSRSRSRSSSSSSSSSSRSLAKTLDPEGYRSAPPRALCSACHTRPAASCASRAVSRGDLSRGSLPAPSRILLAPLALYY